jgi:hypothetical protein
MFGTTAVIPVAPPKKKRSLVPLLTVVFLASYCLMTLLIVEQNAAIQQQHNLIQVLLGDSRELWAMKGKILTDKSARTQAHAQSSTQTPLTRRQAPSVKTPSTQTPSNQTPSTQAQSTQALSTQAPQHRAQSRAGKTAKPEPQLPPVPASDLGDHRRVLISL